MSANDAKTIYSAAQNNGGIPALESVPTSAGTAATATVKREPGMISVKSLLDSLGAISPDEVQVVDKPDRKAAKVEKMLAATREAALKKAAADEKNARGMRMAAAPGQPGFSVGPVSIISARRRMFHGVDPAVLQAAGNPDPFVLHRIAGMTPKGDLAGVFAFGKYKAASVTPFAEWNNKQFRVIGHVEVSHPQTKPAPSQTNFTGCATAYTNTVKTGTYSEELYLTQKTWSIPVMAPTEKSDSGLSASLGITFAFDEALCALLMPSPNDAKAIFAHMVRIMKDGFGVGEISVIGDDQKSKKVAAVSLVGLLELLTHYDVKSSFHFWYKAGTAIKATPTAKDKPMFYDSENMVGGVFAQIYLFVHQIVLQHESGLAPAVIKPKDDAAAILQQATHAEMLKLADENHRLKSQLDALKKTTAADNHAEEVVSLRAKNKSLEETVLKVGKSLAATVREQRAVRVVLNTDYKTVPDVKRAIQLAITPTGSAPSNLSSLSALPSLAAKPTAAATPAAKPAATASDMGDDD